MTMETRYRAVLLPGGVLPAEPAYTALLQAFGERVTAVAKDLEVYAGGRPPADYSLDSEVAGILREADTHGLDRFHLVGYSGGGASSLAFAAHHGERLLSLALLEPAWAGNDRTEAEDALWLRFRALEQLPPDELMAAFVGLQLATGVEPPPRPEGPPPPWMAKRPAGIRAFIDAFDSGASTSTRYGRSTGRCTSRSAAEATPTTTAGWPTGCRRSSPTSRSRRSPSVTTSTRLTASNPSTSPTRCLPSGGARSRSCSFGPHERGGDPRESVYRPIHVNYELALPILTRTRGTAFVLATNRPPFARGASEWIERSRREE
jgi:pimeloyl-ACP methyl ester carboxylesterase